MSGAVRSLSLALTVALSFTLSACCCKQKPEDRARDLERENANLRFQVDASKQAAKAARDYAEELGAGGTGAPVFSMVYAPRDLQRMASDVFPYQIPAKDFDKRMTGNIVVERIENVQFHPGNRLTCTLHMKGRNVRFTGKVPAAYKEHVRRFQEGIEAGVIVELDVSVVMRGASAVEAKSRATKTTLKKNSSDMYERELQDQINNRALKNPLRFDVGIEGTPAKLKRVLLTGNHLVLGYTP